MEKSMKVLERPLTLEEVIALREEDDYIEGVVHVGINELLESDEDDFWDMLSEKLIGSDLLNEMDYAIVGHSDTQTILVRVWGYVTDFLDIYQDGEK